MPRSLYFFNKTRPKIKFENDCLYQGLKKPPAAENQWHFKDSQSVCQTRTLRLRICLGTSGGFGEQERFLAFSRVSSAGAGAEGWHAGACLQHCCQSRGAEPEPRSSQLGAQQATARGWARP